MIFNEKYFWLSRIVAYVLFFLFLGIFISSKYFGDKIADFNIQKVDYVELEDGSLGQISIKMHVTSDFHYATLTLSTNELENDIMIKVSGTVSHNGINDNFSYRIDNVYGKSESDLDYMMKMFSGSSIIFYNEIVYSHISNHKDEPSKGFVETLKQFYIGYKSDTNMVTCGKKVQETKLLCFKLT
ncbi:hypothetical protein [Shewanella gaetbuli]|uniref:Uncharacterized protein n=1 Tax=Shewanella gaetbuli TaxID=220752 RepID=A0A9X1ZQ17_9GAMM|nr:hypothetical protein [Shewanella gaetbuli]MCL1144000.1 hypothetical protein [Shewanella gaetbuli]